MCVCVCVCVCIFVALVRVTVLGKTSQEMQDFTDSGIRDVRLAMKPSYKSYQSYQV